LLLESAVYVSMGALGVLFTTTDVPVTLWLPLLIFGAVVAALWLRRPALSAMWLIVSGAAAAVVTAVAALILG
jgi:hypothetical protein